MNINEKFIINLQGKNFVTYEGLLDLAHQKNLNSIDVEIVQIPTNENSMTAICRATATTNNGRFSDIGDASPQSVNTRIAPHLIRMASTRAKARVLRDLTNVGMTSVEELELTSSEEEVSENINNLENMEGSINSFLEDPPTKRQIDTIKKLSEELNMNIPFETLTKKTAGSLISRMLEERSKKH